MSSMAGRLAGLQINGEARSLSNSSTVYLPDMLLGHGGGRGEGEFQCELCSVVAAASISCANSGNKDNQVTGAAVAFSLARVEIGV
jgi:hypothetical protein